MLRRAAALLPPEPWEPDVWDTWLHLLEQETGRPPGDLIEPLRLALTGEDTGPSLADLLPLMGRARAVSRLEIAAA
jgi:glutamyl-tRNA synthetase